MDFSNRIVTVEGVKYKVEIWDTVGQERFRCISKNMIQNCQGILLLYDISNRSTFEKINMWLNDIKDKAPSDVVMALIGNKCDLTESRQVNEDEGKRIAAEKGLFFYESSAKADINIENIVVEVVKELSLNKVVKEDKVIELRKNEHEKETYGKKSKKKKCC